MQGDGHGDIGCRPQKELHPCQAAMPGDKGLTHRLAWLQFHFDLTAWLIGIYQPAL